MKRIHAYGHHCVVEEERNQQRLLDQARLAAAWLRAVPAAAAAEPKQVAEVVEKERARVQQAKREEKEGRREPRAWARRRAAC